MGSPKVSVCMPMHNAARYLRECIDSVLTQTFTDFEFIIVDDGSTDISVEIVESYTDPRIRLIKREHDYIASLNCLLDEARGEYIARMDADDVMLPNRLEIQLEIMQRNPGIDILGSEYFAIYQPLDSRTKETSTTLTKLTLYDFAFQNRIVGPTSMMKRERVINNSVRYSDVYHYAEDYKFVVDAIISGLSVYHSVVEVLIHGNIGNHADHLNTLQQSCSERAIALFCRSILAQAANTSYTSPIIPETNNKITIIIPFLNEGPELINTVANIREICNNGVEIMVINDHSYDSFDYISALDKFGVIYLYNKTRLGVAASRNMGISLMRTPYFLLLDGHMRIYDYTDIRRIVELLEQDDRCILCGQSIPLDYHGGNLILRDGYSKGFGAFNPMRKGHLLPDIEWCQTEHDPSTDIEEIPAILGAAYAGSKRYWTYLRGLEGLKSYGFDESLLSFKVWLEGGRCLLLKQFITGHLYRDRSPYATLNADKIYNSLYVCSLFYSTKELNRTHAHALAFNFDAHRSAVIEYQNNLPSIKEAKSYYNSISTRDIQFVKDLHATELSRTIKFLNLDNGASDFQSASYLKQKIDYTDRLSLLDGIGAIILYIINNGDLLHYEGLLNDAFGKYRELIELEFKKENPALGFYNGLPGCGWLLLQFASDEYDCIIHEIEHIIESNLNSIIECARQDFGYGIGGVICFAIASLSSNRFSLQPSYWVRLHEVCHTIMNTADYDEETYFFALQYLSLIDNTCDDPDYFPSVSDWLTLPDKQYEKNSLSLLSGELGYELLKSILRNKTLSNV